MTLTTAFGIPIRLHISFLLIAAVMVLMQLVSGGTAAALSSLAMGGALVASVLLHELGHALMARRFGIWTNSITLYPFGGIAALTAEPSRPREELLIAIAGPMVNGALVLLALPLALAGSMAASMFVGINLVLGLFNLLPAFPMDGGRVLRAWLSVRKGRRQATVQALNISRWFAWSFLIAGLLASPNLLLIGGFLLLAINAERRRLAVMWTAQPRRMRRQVSARRWNHPAY